MRQRVGTVARAFELARSGDCETVQEIEKALIGEAYDDVVAHLGGPLIRAQLRILIGESESRQTA